MLRAYTCRECGAALTTDSPQPLCPENMHHGYMAPVSSIRLIESQQLPERLREYDRAMRTNSDVRI